MLLGHFSIILEGAVEWSRRVNGVDIVVGRREAPTYAGAGNALTGDPPVATGVVIEPMRLMRWSAEDFREFIQQAPSAMETTVRLIGPVARWPSRPSASRRSWPRWARCRPAWHTR